EAERAYEHALLGQIRVKTARHLDSVQLFVALGGNSVGVFEQAFAERATHQPKPL
ncbi:MAG: RND transporter, partial [Pseudomonas sp.]